MGGISRGGWQLAPLGQEAEEVRETKARGIFVTGTSTEIGKTVVSAVIARTLAAERGQRVAVFKPCVTGMDEFPDYDEAEARAAVADTAIAVGSGVCPRRRTCRTTPCCAPRRARPRPTTRSPPTATTRRCRRTWRPGWRARRSTRSG